jgi:hypothetical protein
VAWEVEGTDEFAGWFDGLNDQEQVSGGRVVELLVEHGPSLPFPVLLWHCDISTPPHA